MYFFVIVSISVLIPLLTKNKKLGLRISMILLFILLGFQYELVNDWGSNIVRWYYVNEGGTDTATGFELESFFVWLMKLAKPITFFGWLILTAAIFLYLIYVYARLYVPPKYYWLTIFALMSDVSYGVLFINSNRQCISMCFVLIGVLFMISKRKFKIKIPFIRIEWTKYALALLFFFLGSQCHSAAYMSFLLLPIWIFSHKFKGNQWTPLAIICNVLYFSRAFIDITWIQNYADLFISASDVGNVEGYFDSMNSSESVTTLSGGLTTFSVITSICYYYRKFPAHLKFFTMSWYIGFMMASYFTGNVNRLGEYFYIYLIFILPNVFSSVIKNHWSIEKYLGIAAFAIYLGYGSIHCYTQMQTGLYHRWLNYKSIFEAPKWE